MRELDDMRDRLVFMERLQLSCIVDPVVIDWRWIRVDVLSCEFLWNFVHGQQERIGVDLDVGRVHAHDRDRDIVHSNCPLPCGVPLDFEGTRAAVPCEVVLAAASVRRHSWMCIYWAGRDCSPDWVEHVLVHVDLLVFKRKTELFCNREILREYLQLDLKSILRPWNGSEILVLDDRLDSDSILAHIVVIICQYLEPVTRIPHCQPIRQVVSVLQIPHVAVFIYQEVVVGDSVLALGGVLDEI